jgi:hypothetical protein
MNPRKKPIRKGIRNAALLTFMVPILLCAWKKDEYTARYILKIDPVHNNAANEAGIMTLAKSIITKRGELAGFTTHIKEAMGRTMEVTFSNVADTLLLKDIMSFNDRKVEFREIYIATELDSMFFKLGDALIKHKKPRPKFIVSEPYNRDGRITFPTHLGQVQVKDTAAINRLLRDSTVVRVLPAGLRFYYSLPSDTGSNEQYLMIYAVKDGYLKAILGNEDIRRAMVQPNSYDGGPEIRMQFDSAGTYKWLMMTRSNMGRGIAIIVDDMVVYCPYVLSEIHNGMNFINGAFTLSEARKLAIQLGSGTLPARVTILKQEIVKEN